jgi:DNA gyrase subunit A
LHQLSKLEKQKREEELKQILQLIKDLELILNSEERQKEVMKEDLKGIKKVYGDERKTVIIPGRAGEISIEDLVPEEESIILKQREDI